MHMYKLIIDLLNNFLNYIHIPGTPLNPDFPGCICEEAFQSEYYKRETKNQRQ